MSWDEVDSSINESMRKLHYALISDPAFSRFQKTSGVKAA